MGYCTQLLYPIIMTEQQIAVIVVQMHAVAFAIAEHFTVGALPFACPFTVTVRFEFVVPDVDEFIFTCDIYDTDKRLQSFARLMDIKNNT